MIVRIVNFALPIGMGAESNKENPTLASKETVTRCFIDENFYFNLPFRNIKHEKTFQEKTNKIR